MLRRKQGRLGAGSCISTCVGNIRVFPHSIMIASANNLYAYCSINGDFGSYLCTTDMYVRFGGRCTQPAFLNSQNLWPQIQPDKGYKKPSTDAQSEQKFYQSN